MGLAAGEPGFKGFLASPNRLWIHPAFCAVLPGAFSTGVKQAVREGDHSPSSAQVKYGGAIPLMYNDLAVLAFFAKWLRCKHDTVSVNIRRA
jgi:hypothetical protein